MPYSDKPFWKFSFFNRGKVQAILLAQADQRKTVIKKERSTIELHRQTKMQRQTELWSILDLSPELESEYREVSTIIADDIQKIAALDAFFNKLQNAISDCQAGRFKYLEGLLKLPSPAEEVHYEVPIVHYKIN